MAQLLAIISFGVAIQRAESRLLHGDSKQVEGGYDGGGSGVGQVSTPPSEPPRSLLRSPPGGGAKGSQDGPSAA